jgi:hypothetical protein
MVVGLLLIILGVLLSHTVIGAIFGIPIAVIGLVVFVLAIFLGGISGIFRLLGFGRR